MTIKYRQCNLKDLDLLIKISRFTYKESFGRDNTESNMRKYLDSAFKKNILKKELSNENSEFYFAIISSIIIGYFKINAYPAQTDIKDPFSLELERIYILKEYQGKNYGKKLLEKVIDIAKKRKLMYLWLGVWNKNIKAIQFYKRNGFIKFDEHKFNMGKDEQIDYLMKFIL